MILRYSFGVCVVGFALVGCGVGDPADIGADRNHQGNTGGGAGDGATGGATAETGGHSTAGGAGDSAGGSTTSTGGATHTTGGATHATGGATHGTGGSLAAGGSTHGAGGATEGTGGSAGGIPCGKHTCGTGEYCCNLSCSMCAPMGAACTTIACVPDPTDAGPPHCVQNVACIKGDVWSPTECKCVPAGAACGSAADCNLVADYCDGCNCLALSPGQKPPACAGQMVQCLIDPCSTKTAACVNGHCVAQ